MWGKALAVSFGFLLCFAARADADPQSDARNATVVIQGEVMTNDGLRYAIGAGVIVRQDDGLEIVTAYHVAKRANLIVKTSDGQVLPVVEMVHVPPQDIAVIKTRSADNVFPSIAMTGVVFPGSSMFTYGAPNNQQWMLSRGTIDKAMLPGDYFARGEFAMSCATCDNGSSGGGIFTERGELEGILTAQYTKGDGTQAFMAEPILEVPWLLSNL